MTTTEARFYLDPVVAELFRQAARSWREAWHGTARLRAPDQSPRYQHLVGVGDGYLDAASYVLGHGRRGESTMSLREMFTAWAGVEREAILVGAGPLHGVAPWERPPIADATCCTGTVSTPTGAVVHYDGPCPVHDEPEPPEGRPPLGVCDDDPDGVHHVGCGCE